jgi:hypothetical protein
MSLTTGKKSSSRLEKNGYQELEESDENEENPVMNTSAAIKNVSFKDPAASEPTPKNSVNKRVKNNRSQLASESRSTEQNESVKERKKKIFASQKHLIKLLESAKKQSEEQFSKITERANPIFQFIQRQWEEGPLEAFLLWILWIITGTLFYANVLFYGDYDKGFYYSVNVGYSIGWGVFHDNTAGCKVFSMFYLLIGALFVSRYVAYLLENAIAEKENIYEQYMLRAHLLKTNKYANSNKTLSEIYVWIIMNNNKLLVIYLWLVFWIFGVVWSCASFGWPVVDGCYFSLSTMSTGGLWGIPQSAVSGDFIVVGFFAWLGVPLMGMAMANIAILIMEQRDLLKNQKELAHLEISEKERLLLELFIANNDRQYIDKNEFLLLNLLKRKKVDIKTISDIYAEFDSLDTKATGVLTFMDIQERVKIRSESEKQREQSEMFSGRKSSISRPPVSSNSGSPLRSNSIRSPIETSVVVNELHLNNSGKNRLSDDMDESPI